MEQLRHGGRNQAGRSANNLFTEELKTKSEELKATNKNHGQWTTTIVH